MFFRRNLEKNDLLSKSFCIFAGAIRMESRHIGYELAFAFSSCPPKRGKFQQDNVARIDVERKDKVNAHAIGVG